MLVSMGHICYVILILHCVTQFGKMAQNALAN